MALHPRSLHRALESRRRLVPGRRVVRPVAAICALALLIAGVATATTAPAGTDALADDAPAAAVGAYLDAWRSGDLDRAWSSLGPAAQSTIGRDRFDEEWRWRTDGRPFVAWRYTATTGDTERATVTVAVAWGNGGFPRDGRVTGIVRVTLDAVDGTWRIATPILGPERW